MCADEVARGEGTDEGELASHDGRSDDACKLLCVLAWVRGVCALDTEHLEDGTLRCEDGATTDSANFNRRHGNGNPKILTTVASVEKNQVNTDSQDKREKSPLTVPSKSYNSNSPHSVPDPDQ